MPSRKNLVHRKLAKANPDNRIHFQVGIKAGLLKGKVTTYGQAADYIRAALEAYNKTMHHDALLQLIVQVRSNIETLELWKNQENNPPDSRFNEAHSILLEGYRDTYLRLRDLLKLIKKRFVSLMLGCALACIQWPMVCVKFRMVMCSGTFLS